MQIQKIGFMPVVSKQNKTAKLNQTAAKPYENDTVTFSNKKTAKGGLKLKAAALLMAASVALSGCAAKKSITPDINIKPNQSIVEQYDEKGNRIVNIYENGELVETRTYGKYGDGSDTIDINKYKNGNLSENIWCLCDENGEPKYAEVTKYDENGEWLEGHTYTKEDGVWTEVEFPNGGLNLPPLPEPDPIEVTPDILK